MRTIKKTIFIAVGLMFLSFWSVWGQNDSSMYKKPDMVINFEMIEMFYRAYNKIQVFPWLDMLSN